MSASGFSLRRHNCPSPQTRRENTSTGNGLDATEAIALDARHSDTPNIEPDHTRRRSTANPYVWATLLDRMDAGRLLVDPKGPYQTVAKNSMNRRKDRIVLAALGGNAYGGKAGGTTIALPAAQKNSSRLRWYDHSQALGS